MGRLALSILLAVLAVACSSETQRYRQAARIPNGDPHRGRDAILRYGCPQCHTIPGIRTAHGVVGPPLAGIAWRAYLAGELPNSPENMMHWIQHPQAVEQHTVMPEMGVSEDESRDITAYLYTLR